MKLMECLRKALTVILRSRYFHWLNDRVYLKLQFRLRVGYRLNLDKPVTFNEKLQWLKLNDRNPIYTKLVDKYEVREYISNKLGEDYLIPLLGVYESFDDINFDELPDSFVLKCTHDSGGVVICKDKRSLDIPAARRKIESRMANNYYHHGREWPYKDIKPRIIIEKFMTDESGIELKDYKVFCFNGEPRVIQVDFGRFTKHKRNLYTTEWEYICLSVEYPTDPSINIPKPENLVEMLQSARILSMGFPHVRVDFYSVIDRILFGEMTFYHGSGYEKFDPKKFDYLFGEWIMLPGSSEVTPIKEVND